MLIKIFAFVLFMGRSLSVEVHFEENSSGFFLKHSLRKAPVNVEASNIYPSSIMSTYSMTKSSGQDSLLSVDRFTIVQTNQPVAIRATYGPFSTKQTVPARYIVPDTIDSKGDHSYNVTAALVVLKQQNQHLDISAHLVRSVIHRDAPVLRVLFHTGSDPSGNRQGEKICAMLLVSMESRTPLKGSCMPEGEDGICIAEIVIPSSWWPQLPPPKGNLRNAYEKVTQPQAHVSYSVYEPPTKNQELCEPKIQIQPLTSFAKVRLVPAQYPYKDIRIDELLTILIPQYPLYSKSKIHVPVFLHQKADKIITLFIVRARIKSGIRIHGATGSCDSWSISVEKENPKPNFIRVTALLKDAVHQNISSSFGNSVLEIFSWLVEFTNDGNDWDGGKIVWSVSYIHDSSKLKGAHLSHDSIPNEGRKKIVTKHELNKDDVQAVLPIAKSWQLINTAVLNGRQVSQALKIFIVSQVGKIADVTLQSSCQSDDESVIKVSSSCSSVYVDGTEIRGSSNASIIVKYASYKGVAKFTIWMPEFPLEVYVSDFRLSQIKAWKVPEYQQSLLFKNNFMRKRRSRLGNQRFLDNEMTTDKGNCRCRYQQTSVDVFARFSAKDQNSGRVSYLISRRTGLLVTDLIEPLLRVADPKIASLNGKILKGKSMGRTDVQVLSPISGRVIGAKEIRVGSDKVSLTKLVVRVVSGLQLSIAPDNSIDNGFIAETTISRKLTAQYQEGLLDIDLEFSDGMKIPLRELPVYDYTLLVESLDTEVVAFAPMLASHHPRVIAVGEGNGDLLRVTLLLPEVCRVRRNLLMPKSTKASSNVLSSALASVQVDFDIVDNSNKPDLVQNDGIFGKEGRYVHRSSDLADIISIPLKDRYEPVPKSKQIFTRMKNFNGAGESHNGLITPLEIGMYVLLTTFCFAIVVFIISCVVYASKFRPLHIETGLEPLSYNKFNLKRHEKLRTIGFPIECTTNAHDWVWLGRSTLDKTSNTNCKGETTIRIINNPASNLPFSGINNVTTFGYQINSRNYSASDFFNQSDQSLPPPVPPHRHNSSTVNEHEKEKIKEIGQKGYAIAYLCSLQEFSPAPYVALKFSAKLNSLAHNNRDSLPYYNHYANELTLLEKTVESNYILKENTQKLSTDAIVSSNPLPNEAGKLHMAEILVASSEQSENNVFQFESITFDRGLCRKSSQKAAVLQLKTDKIDSKHVKEKEQNLVIQPVLNSKDSLIKPSFQNVPFNINQTTKSLISQQTYNHLENPTFKRLLFDDDLRLENLNMNYEQIMKYFHELKESNA